MIDGIDRVITAASGEEALRRAGSELPDVVLLDVGVPGLGGLETTRQFHASYPEIPVLILAGPQDAEAAGRAVEAGARGYVAKDASREELAAAIALALTASPHALTGRTPPSGRRPVLSTREQQVLEGIARGLSNGEIGRELFLTEDTVKTHARRLYRKMGATDRAGAVANGFRWGLLR